MRYIELRRGAMRCVSFGYVVDPGGGGERGAADHSKAMMGVLHVVKRGLSFFVSCWILWALSCSDFGASQFYGTLRIPLRQVCVTTRYIVFGGAPAFGIPQSEGAEHGLRGEACCLTRC